MAFNVIETSNESNYIILYKNINKLKLIKVSSTINIINYKYFIYIFR